MPEVLTIHEEAGRLWLKDDTVRDWLKSDKLKGVKLGRLWRMDAEDLERLPKGEPTAENIDDIATAEEQRTRGTMAANHHALVLAMAVDKGNLSTSLRGLERKGLIRIYRTPGGKAESVDLIPARQRVTEL